MDRLAEKFKGDHKLANYVKQEKNRIDSKLAHQKVLKRSYEKGNRFGRVDRGMSAFASATLQVARNVTARLTHPFSSAKKAAEERSKKLEGETKRLKDLQKEAQKASSSQPPKSPVNKSPKKKPETGKKKPPEKGKETGTVKKKPPGTGKKKPPEKGKGTGTGKKKTE